MKSGRFTNEVSFQIHTYLSLFQKGEESLQNSERWLTSMQFTSEEEKRFKNWGC